MRRKAGHFPKLTNRFGNCIATSYELVEQYYTIRTLMGRVASLYATVIILIRYMTLYANRWIIVIIKVC